VPARVIASSRGIASPRAIASPRGWASPRGFTGVQQFLPSDIADLLIWLTADDLGLADATAVAAWANKGSGADFSQATADNRPIFKVAIQNGLGVVRFDGGNDVLLSDSVMSLAQPCTLYLVAQRTGNTSAFNVVISQDPEAVAAGFNNAVNTWYTFTNPALVSQAAADNAFHIMAATIDGASSVMRTDGVANAVALDAGDVTADTWAVGATVAAGAPLAGDIGEILVYAGEHTAGQIDLVEGYLASASRWGITLA